MAGLMNNLFPNLRRRRLFGGAEEQPAPQPPPQPQQQQQQNQQPPPQQPPPRQQQQQQQQNAEQQFVVIRDRLFHAMFVRLSLGYARVLSPRVRRMIEFASLLVAICSLIMLSYIHVAFSHLPTHCLDRVKSDWPRDGILRVEIIRNPGEEYTLAKSYEKEERLKLRDPDSLLLSTLEDLLDGDKRSRRNQADDEAAGGASEGDQPLVPASAADGAVEGDPTPGDPASDFINATDLSAGGGPLHLLSEPTPQEEQQQAAEEPDPEPEAASGDSGAELNGTEAEPPPAPAADSTELDQDVTGFERLIRTVWPDEEYIVEYSLEYGLLRLSPATRRRLSVPTKIVLLDPDTDVCFGDHLSRLILARLIGYDDILLSSIKELAEAEDNRGYLRNVVTGEHYRFVSNWPTSTSFFAAFFIMIIFTLTVSMLLRYSHQQIFLFIVDLLQMVETNTIAHLPATSLLTVILALVGMEALMSEFFNDSTTAFYVILIVWLVDQYDAVCCHTAISRKHFLRFFFLYHYCFYAYHYRFNGQYSSLALVTSWLFIQHAMFYFFHHYELPVILRNAQIQRLVTNAIRRDNLRRAGQPAAPTPEELLLAMMDAPGPGPAPAPAPAPAVATATTAAVAAAAATSTATATVMATAAADAPSPPAAAAPSPSPPAAAAPSPSPAVAAAPASAAAQAQTQTPASAAAAAPAEAPVAAPAAVSAPAAQDGTQTDAAGSREAAAAGPVGTAPAAPADWSEERQCQLAAAASAPAGDVPDQAESGSRSGV